LTFHEEIPPSVMVGDLFTREEREGDEKQDQLDVGVKGTASGHTWRGRGTWRGQQGRARHGTLHVGRRAIRSWMERDERSEHNDERSALFRDVGERAGRTTNTGHGLGTGESPGGLSNERTVDHLGRKEEEGREDRSGCFERVSVSLSWCS
jgi:hypothetical protein